MPGDGGQGVKLPAGTTAGGVGGGVSEANLNGGDDGACVVFVIGGDNIDAGNVGDRDRDGRGEGESKNERSKVGLGDLGVAVDASTGDGDSLGRRMRSGGRVCTLGLT